jgi:Trp operon repressor
MKKKMHQMSTNMSQKKDNIEWRRNKVQELLVKGYNHYEIATILQISRPTITRDIQYLNECAKQNIKKYIDERLPEEYEKCLVGLNAITKEAWNTSQQAQDKREKIQALSLAKECYSMKLDLLTNATVIDDAIRFVSDKSKEKEKVKSAAEGDKEVSNEPGYDEDKDQQEEEQEVEEITSTTTNQVF